uniref:Uncharacterized protein n=1 Tax=Lepeophtheirus salmonis TaxID=72036 RepID=A0A0K2TVB8_LEPSM
MLFVCNNIYFICIIQYYCVMNFFQKTEFRSQMKTLHLLIKDLYSLIIVPM